MCKVQRYSYRGRYDYILKAAGKPRLSEVIDEVRSTVVKVLVVLVLRTWRTWAVAESYLTVEYLILLDGYWLAALPLSTGNPVTLMQDHARSIRTDQTGGQFDMARPRPFLPYSKPQPPRTLQFRPAFRL